MLKAKHIVEDDLSSKEADEMVKKEKSKTPNRFTHNHYKIFRVEKDKKTGKDKKITMKKFWAKDDAEAFDYLNEYKKVANKIYTYYYGTTGYYIYKDKKTGKIMHYDDMEEMHEVWAKEHNNIFKRFWDNICYRLPDFRNIKYKIKCLLYFFKTGHMYEEVYSLDHHIINDLLHNLPRIKEDKGGVPNEFCVKAAKLLHAKDKDFNIDKYLKENPNLDEEGLFDLAKKMFNEVLDKGILYAKLYSYYLDHGIIDKTNKEEVEFDKVWSKTIPYKPGTYKEYDFNKLSELTKKNWNALMNWCKENLQYCWT